MLNRIFLFLTIGLSGAFMLNSCGVCTSKKYSCDTGLDSIARRWFKLDSGKQLIFTNNTLTDTISLHTFVASTTETARSGGFESKPIPCESSLYARSSEKDSNGRFKFTLMYQLDTYYPGKNQQCSNSYLNLHGTTYWFYSIDQNLGITSSSDSSTIIEHFNSPNGLTYTHVNRLMIDSSLIKTDQPYKLYVAYDHGLIGYETYPSHQIWSIKP